MEKTIRLILVDDHDVVRTGCKDLFWKNNLVFRWSAKLAVGNQAIAIARF